MRLGLRTTTFALSMVVALTVLAQEGGDYYGGLEAYERGDHEVAIELWQPLVRQGDDEASYRLALLYESAPAPYRDPSAAVQLYERLATDGNPRAQNNLGRCFEAGIGTEVNLERAVHWYRQAARQGRSIAQANLARLYESGRGVSRSLDDAIRWYRAAASQGHAGSQNRVGYAYATGEGLPSDGGQAAKWFKRAAKNDLADAQNNLAVLLDEGRAGKAQPGKALDGYARAAAQDLVAAQINLAGKYRHGRGVIRDTAKADLWVQRIKGRQREPFTLTLALPFDPPPTSEPKPVVVTLEPTKTIEPTVVEPTVVEPTVVEPVESTVERVESSVTPDQWYERALAYGSGEGKSRDLAAAEQAYRRAADAGHGMAAYKLGFVYMRGLSAHGKVDYLEAHRWFGVAASRGIGDAATWQKKMSEKLTRKERRDAGLDD
ncbi:MAG: hypothetical protein OEV00_09280 [Acidobacteriota bacterium]|nr:hypothetical protein [Acidobacteriota bacterium]MDH3785503.1 hypothetical protein [Acidobacteriota bacterium]